MTNIETVIDIVYENIILVSGDENKYLVKMNNKWGLINEKGDIIIPIIYNDLIHMEYDEYYVGQSGKWGVINENNEIIIPIEYTNLMQIGADKFMVSQNNRWGIIKLN